MADTKITALTSISTGTDPANDVFPIVDISDNAITASGTTKKVTTNQLLGAGGTASFATLAVSGLTTLSNNIVMASAKGIDFSATANSSGTMTSELLADYEEGTWVPTDDSGAGLTFTTAYCRYTKVGRLVTVQGLVTYPSTASGASALWGGFPFVAADNIFLTIGYTPTPIAAFAYFSGTNTQVYLLAPGVNTINSSLSLQNISFFGTYMV
jgi:hypothetical protein